MKHFMTSMYTKGKGVIDNEKGSQTLEWVAIGGIILVLMAAITTVFQGDSSVGQAIVDKLTELIGNIG
ncbi:hypothetical protein [Bacillus marinisedimentorum]|uniref:hypothetical protein n=1 Tax=Bacillus marinisedimentorum TaxID=1821260 RepID=UPI000872AE06|nr:hypothetical protein [Bacillus marinisedimentorum]